MAKLGNPKWGITLTEPTGRIVWQADRDHSGWNFERTLSAMSEASVTIQWTPTLADRLEPWLHILTIWADEEPAWYGIVVRVEVAGGKIIVSAADGAAFFKRRRLPSGRTYDQADASLVMSQVVVDGMGPSDPLEVASNITSLDSRVWVVVDHTSNSVMIDDVIGDLVDAGLEWTFYGGTLMIGPIMSRYRTQTLSDKHFDGEVKVVKEGKDVITDVLVNGEGVWGQQAIPDDRIVLQSIEKGDNLVTSQDCQVRAGAILKEQGVSPVLVEMGQAKLTPETPIGLSELVPGVIVPLSSTQTGIRVGSDLRIEEVKVDDGKVSVNFGTPGPSWEERQEFPPPPTMDHQSPWVKEQSDKNNEAAGNDKSYDADWVKPGIPL